MALREHVRVRLEGVLDLQDFRSPQLVIARKASMVDLGRT
jgi:hypothetical protein